MLKTVKHGSGIRVDPPPVFSKFPHFPVFFGGELPLVNFRLIFSLNFFPLHSEEFDSEGTTRAVASFRGTPFVYSRRG